ncbi:hypothetical protein HNV12_06565 [Methanococcoides sp. SA1]|nr:hypothetical protein [Methanococcoides sp. SA1]
MSAFSEHYNRPDNRAYTKLNLDYLEGKVSESEYRKARSRIDKQFGKGIKTMSTKNTSTTKKRSYKQGLGRNEFKKGMAMQISQGKSPDKAYLRMQQIAKDPDKVHAFRKQVAHERGMTKYEFRKRMAIAIKGGKSPDQAYNAVKKQAEDIRNSRK